LGHGVLFD